jgi:5'-nucleotidase
MQIKSWVGAAIVASGSWALGCAADVADVEGDAEHDSFLVDGKADGTIEEGSLAACAVLKVINASTRTILDRDVKLDRRAARNVHAHIAGRDRRLGTDDDRWYTSLAELAGLAWVGPSAFGKLRSFAAAQGVTCGDVAVQLLAFNDYHGNLDPPAGSSGRIQTGPDAAVDRVDAGGVEFMTTHVRRLAATNPNTVVVAAGDVIGATPLLSALFHDEPSIESMNLLGLAVASVGNHEFDEGVDELFRMQEGGCHPVDGCQDGDDFAGAQFRYLAANVTMADGETIFPAYTVRTFGNARVAFIGLTLEGTPLVTSPSGVAGLAFADEADTINALVPEIQDRGIEAIVVLLHEGGAVTGRYDQCLGMSGPVFEIASRLDPAVDVLVAGHTNAAHVCDLGGLLVTSAASFGRLVTDVDLVVSERTGEVTTRAAVNVIVTRDVERAADQTALIAKYRALSAPLANRVVARTSGDLLKAQNLAGESVAGDVIADAQLAATRSAGAVAAFMNPGGVRADIVAAAVSGGEQPGEVTYAEAFTVQPFGNTLVTLTVTGDQIRRMLEQQWQLVGGAEKANVLAPSSGFAYSWDPARPLGSRVVEGSIAIDGVPVAAATTYRVTVNAFLADGGDGFAVLREGQDRTGGGLDLDAFTAHLGASTPFAPPATGRITRIAAP